MRIRETLDRLVEGGASGTRSEGDLVALLPRARSVKVQVTLGAEGAFLFSPASRLGDLFDDYRRLAGGEYDPRRRANIVTNPGRALDSVLRLSELFAVGGSREAVVALVAAARERLQRITDAEWRVLEVGAVLASRGHAVRPFQVEGITHLASWARTMLTDDMGLGKTLQALVALPKEAPILVVGPAVAKYVWVDEAKVYRPDLKVSALSGRGALRRFPKPGEMLVINFDLLGWDCMQGSPALKVDDDRNAFLDRALGRCEVPAKVKTRKGEEVPRCRRFFRGATTAMAATCPKVWPARKCGRGVETCHDPTTPPPGMHLVIDEAHYLQSVRSRRSLAVRRLASRSSVVWGLTATPMTDRFQQLRNVLSVLELSRPVFGTYEEFLFLTGGERGEYGGVLFEGQVSPEVSVRLRKVMLGRMKTDVLGELPPLTVRDLYVDVRDPRLVRAAARLMRELENRKIDLDKVEDVGELPSIEEMSLVRAELARAKIPAMLELVEQHEASQTPLLVFSAHHAPLEELKGRPGWSLITGETPPEERRRIAERFQAGEGIGIALGIKAGGVALTLTRASNLVFVDLRWTPADNDQARDRAHRIGQDQPVSVTRIVADHPLDRHLLRLLTKKSKDIELTVDAARAPEV